MTLTDLNHFGGAKLTDARIAVTDLRTGRNPFSPDPKCNFLTRIDGLW